IGWNLSVETIDAFFEGHETPGYKFDIDSEGNVFIVEMEGAEHTSVIELLIDYFKIPNGGIILNAPIKVEINSAHYRPYGRGLGRRPSRHLEIPPVDRGGRPHARIMCEIAVSQSCDDLKAKCERWMRQEYALWSRQAVPTHRQVAVAGRPGVFVEEWDFGTIDYHNHLATACIGPGLPNYQITIPVRDVFWNPPVVGGVPNTAGYVPVAPAGLVPNFIIDLFNIQQTVLQNQDNN
ncbi:7591_t:CDS:2, partial [Paraglomus brasilianum]